MSKITTTDLVNKIFAFCEAYSGVEFFPYQAQFGKRIIRSILENDGEEITALFSRQCLHGDSKIHMADGSRKNIRDVKVGDKVLAFDYNKFVKREVIDSYKVGRREVYKLKLKSGDTIECTLNHRFLERHSKLFKELSRFEAGDEIGYINSKGKPRFSRIDEIRFMGDKETYDIEVEGAENFLANNILVHNSGN